MNKLNEIKKLIPNCTFLAFESAKGNLFFKAVLKDGKNTDRVRIEIKCPLDEISQKEYDQVYDILLNKRYEQRKETV